MYIAGYSVLFLASLVSGLLIFVFEKKSKTLDFISVFGGAFLMAVCFDYLSIQFVRIHTLTNISMNIITAFLFLSEVLYY